MLDNTVVVVVVVDVSVNRAFESSGATSWKQGNEKGISIYFMRVLVAGFYTVAGLTVIPTVNHFHV